MPKEKFTQPEDFKGNKQRIRNEIKKIPQDLLDAVIPSGELADLLSDDSKIFEAGKKAYGGILLKYKTDTSEEGKKYVAQAKTKLREIVNLIAQETTVERGGSVPKPVIDKEKKNLESIKLSKDDQDKLDERVELAKKVLVLHPGMEVSGKSTAELAELVAQAEEKEKAAKEAKEKKVLERQEKVNQLVASGEYEEAELAGKTDAQLAKMIQKLAADEKAEREQAEKIKLSEDISTAYAYLIKVKKLPQAELDAIPNNAAAIQKAQELSGKTIDAVKLDLAAQVKAERSREAKRANNVTAKKLEEIITPEMKNEINALLDRADLPIVTHEQPDLDAKAAIYLLRVFGKSKNGPNESIPKGTSTDRGILVDAGNSKGLLTVGTDRLEANHHYDNLWIKTSSAEIVLETLIKVGRIEKVEPWMREFVSFITDVDNMSYPRHEEDPTWFKNNYAKTLVGLHKVLSVETLIEFFKAGKNPYEPLTDEELSRSCTTSGEKPTTTTVRYLTRRAQKMVNKSIVGAAWHENSRVALGNKTYSNELGKVLYYEPTYKMVRDEEKGIDEPVEINPVPLTAHAAYMLGYDTFIRSEPEKKGYFISFPNRKLNPLYNRMQKKDPNAIIVRGSMVLNYPDKNRGSDGSHISKFQLLNYVGLNIDNGDNLVTSTEWQTRRIVRALTRLEKKTYPQKLAEAKTILEGFLRRTQENRAMFEAKINESKDSTARNIVTRNKMLRDKIAGLTQEGQLWEAKLARLEELRGLPESEFATLFDESKLNLAGGTPSEEEEGDAVIAAGSEETVVETEPAVSASTTEAPKITTAPAPTETKVTPSGSGVLETAKTLEREKALEALTQRYVVIERILASPAPADKEAAEKELIELSTEHYNIHAYYHFLLNGGTGAAPKPITYTELVEMKRAKQAAQAPKTPAAPTAPAAPTGRPSTETAGSSIPNPEGPAQVDKVLVDKIVNLLSGTDKAETAAAFSAVRNQREYNQLISKTKEKVRAQWEASVIRERTRELDDYYSTDIIPADMDWGVEVEDERGNPIPGRAFINMDGTDYSAEELANTPAVKSRDPRALKLLDMVQKTQEKIDAINDKYERRLAAF